MISLAIRNMNIDDINSILKISLLSFPEVWSRNSMEKEMLGNKFARYLVAIADNMIVGYGGMWIIIDEAHITNIAVHPEYRSIGIGTTLLVGLIEASKKESVTGMTLEVRRSNMVAHSLYKKLGFAEEGFRKAYYADNKEDAIIMWKRDL